MHIRPYESRDRTAVVAIMNRCGNHVTEEEFERDLDEPGERQRENSFVAIVDDAVVGSIRLCFVQTESSSEYEVFCFGEVHPDYRRRGVGSALYRYAVEHLKQLCQGESCSVILTQTVDVSNIHQRKILKRCGFHETVRLFGMQRPVNAFHLPTVVLPEGFQIRPVTLEDAAACATVDNQAFLWRAVHATTTVESVRYEMMAEDFHPELYPVLVEPSGHVVGYAHCSVTPGDTHGKIHHIAVLPDYQGRRLGKALLNHCIRTLAEQGVEVVQLSVESDNPTAALTMYQNAGFETYREWIRYTLELSGISNSR